MRKILFIIQLPPPVHGASLMNKLVFDRMNLNPANKCKLIKLNFARNLSDLQKFKPRKIFRALSIVFEIIFKSISFRPDIVYFSMVPIGYVLIRDSLYLILLKLFAPNSKKVIHLHRPGLAQFYNRNKGIIKLYKLLFKNCELVHLTAGLAQKELIPLNLTNSKVTVVPNSIIKAHAYSFEPTKDSNNILFLSNFLRHKGYLELVDAFFMLHQKYPALSLTLAGAFVNESDREELLEKIHGYQLDNYVEVVGPVYGSKRYELYNRAGIFVLPSKLEYFPLVILEAMSERCAVICSGRSNLDGVFVDYEHLLYLENTEPQGIYNKIAELVESPELAKAIANKGYDQYLKIQNESLYKIDKLFELT
jgi:glycosyltransferase involved in cell wall biosynthesis